MASVVFQNVRGVPQGEPVAVRGNMRRLSTIAKRYANERRPFMVSVFRDGDPFQITDDTVRPRKEWAQTLVGKTDIVVVTYLPRGGGAQGKQQGKQIGMAVAAIALAIVLPGIGAAVGLAGPVAALGGVVSWSTLLTAGAAGIALGASYLLNRSNKTKDKQQEDNSIYGVSGGGNLPRTGERIPRLYGKAWISPDLSQPAYIVNAGEDQDLYQRMTLTLGYCTPHTIKVGDAVMWTSAGGVTAAFAGALVEIIEPGATSNLVPAAVISAQSVSSQDLPRPGATVPWTGPFPLTPVGRNTGYVQLDYSLPQGVFSQFTNGQGSQTGPTAWGVQFQYAECDEDDNVTGPWQDLLVDSGYHQSTKPLRYTKFVTIDAAKRYVVRACNLFADTEPGNHRVTGITNMVMWDGMRAWMGETIVRPHVTELAIKVRSGKALGVTAFNNIKVEATARLPVWTGGSWQLQETRKAVDAYADIMRGTVNGFVYGAGLSDSDLDLDRLLFYRTTLTTFDTFDGVIRGPVSVYNAAETVLGVIRAQPLQVGSGWSFNRDEARTTRKHVITRRQIPKGSSSTDFGLSLSDGSADVIVEYSPDADPARRNEVRRFFGTKTTTPRRYNMAGVSTHDHAYMLATWIAASAYFRREKRSFTTELEYRLIRRGDPALIDTWYMGEESRAAGVVSRNGFVLHLDTPIEVAPGFFLYVRDKKNREFGPIRITQGANEYEIVANSTDVATVSGFYTPTVAWASLWQAEGDELTSVLIGPLTEIAEPYLIQAVEPQGRRRANITAVIDSPAVWTALGEVAPAQPPVPGVEDILGPTVPLVPWVRAHALQDTTALNMHWSIGDARSAARYVVELSYEQWATAEVVSDGPQTSGTFAIRHVEDVDVYIRAYAISASGVVGPKTYSSFRTFKPVISNDFAALEIELADLTAQVRQDISAVNDLGQDSIRRLLMDLDDKVEHLASDVMRAQAGLAERQTILLARSGQNQALITREERARVTAESAVAETIQTVSTTLNNQTATLTSYSGSIDGMKVQWGIVGNINGVTGGMVLTGVRRLDGAVSYSLGIQGDLIVDGTVWGHKLAASNLITNAAQIGSLTVDNLHVRNGALTQVASAEGDNFAAVGINLRGTGNVIVFAYYKGAPSTPRSIGNIGSLIVRRFGDVISSSSNNFYIAGAGQYTAAYMVGTVIIARDSPGVGYYEFSVEDTYGGGVKIVVMEASK